MNTLTGKLYSGIAAAVLAAMPSVAQAHSEYERDGLGRIVGQTCKEGDSLFMESKVLYAGTELVPIAVVATDYALQQKEMILYNHTTGVKVVNIEDRVTPTSAPDVVEEDARDVTFECKRGKSFCSSSDGYSGLPVGYVKHEAKNRLQMFVCNQGKDKCVTFGGYRVPLGYVKHRAKESFLILGSVLTEAKKR